MYNFLIIREKEREIILTAMSIVDLNEIRSSQVPFSLGSELVDALSPGMVSIEAHDRTSGFCMSIGPNVFAAALSIVEHLIGRADNTHELALCVPNGFEKPFMRTIMRTEEDVTSRLEQTDHESLVL